MSNKSAHPGRDFSRFDVMSTEELKELLYQDSLLPSGQETDMDAILYIMEVVAKREATEHPEICPDTEKAWKSFNELYRSEDNDGTSLYEEVEDEPEPILTAVPTPPNEHSKPRKNIRFVLRTAIVAAVLIVILVGSSLVACASGFDLWGAVAQWTKETFGFNTSSMPLDKSALYSESNDPRDVLLKYDISVPLLPTWMPEGYSFQEIEFMEAPTRRVFYVRYINGNQKISMTIALLSGASTYAHEKNSPDAITYPSNGIDHFIMENMDQITIVWTIGTYECSIRGSISVEEAQNIIDSIYRS